MCSNPLNLPWAMGPIILDLDQLIAQPLPARCSKKLSSRMLVLPGMLIDLAKFAAQWRSGMFWLRVRNGEIIHELWIVSNDRVNSCRPILETSRNFQKHPKTIQNKERQWKNTDADQAVQNVKTILRQESIHASVFAWFCLLKFTGVECSPRGSGIIVGLSFSRCVPKHREKPQGSWLNPENNETPHNTWKINME